MDSSDHDFASTLRLLLNEYDIYDVVTLADYIEAAGDTLAAWLRSDGAADRLAEL